MKDLAQIGRAVNSAATKRTKIQQQAAGVLVTYSDGTEDWYTVRGGYVYRDGRQLTWHDGVTAKLSGELLDFVRREVRRQKAWDRRNLP